MYHAALQTPAHLQEAGAHLRSALCTEKSSALPPTESMCSSNRLGRKDPGVKTRRGREGQTDLSVAVSLCEVTLATAVNHRGMPSLLVRTKFSGAVGMGVIRKKNGTGGHPKAGEKDWPKSTDREPRTAFRHLQNALEVCAFK